VGSLVIFIIAVGILFLVVWLRGDDIRSFRGKNTSDKSGISMLSILFV
jgi:hypothetical protein